MIDERTTHRSKFWREFLVLLAVATVVALIVRTFAIQTFFIPSVSMQHTLNVDDQVLANKMVYHFRGPHRGEIIVFKAPTLWTGGPIQKDYIKRVIATGGDHVVCCDARDRLTVNGRALDEPYLFHDANGVSDRASNKPFDVTIPPGRLWVMGDHRSQSADSREHYLENRNAIDATIPESSVIGRAFVAFWPISRAQWLTVPATFAKIPDPS